MTTITNRHRPMTDEIVVIHEAFGCAPPAPGDRQPTVRPAVSRDGRVLAYPLREVDSLDPDTNATGARLTLPDGSYFSAYGDDTTGCYVHAYGITAEAARDMFHRIEAALPSFLNAIWRTR